MKKLSFVVLIVFAAISSLEANQSGFLWQLAESHRQDGNLVLEEVP